ncbi:hypothetical protein GCM10012320_32830 [Sinomonas cellulolyticus]|uniref:Uncharacterized protein n=1 Tax=Sinomonas cellulolyticus TaxID=2801916 RepID=A0ABS1JZA4_9MICC|nr:MULTISPECIES: hypothetical protein [Sinomonas]MBL0703977.1 hypothetical protein [Sinomonas cellulolyticus]GHG58991.1 hypothetical protein GCM10012320_32830 [Sinomonas sp. KCTC 49339]
MSHRTLPHDPLGLGTAIEALPEAAHTRPGDLLALYRAAYTALCADLAEALTHRVTPAQLAEYAAAARYQHHHPGTGQHTRAWITANLPPHAARIAAACTSTAAARARQELQGRAPAPGTEHGGTPASARRDRQGREPGPARPRTRACPAAGARGPDSPSPH